MSVNHELRRSLARVQTVLCEAATALETLADSKLAIQVTCMEGVTAVQVLEHLGCSIEFEPVDKEAFDGGPTDNTAWLHETAIVTVPGK